MIACRKRIQRPLARRCALARTASPNDAVATHRVELGDHALPLELIIERVVEVGIAPDRGHVRKEAFAAAGGYSGRRTRSGAEYRMLCVASTMSM
jgi:hypothetical protein